MHHTVSKLLKYVGLVIGLGLLASCSNSLNGRELAPNKEVAPYYVASVKIDGSSTQAEVEQALMAGEFKVLSWAAAMALALRVLAMPQ